MDESDLIKHAVEFSAEIGRQQFERRFSAVLDRAESPIERVLLAMFVAFEVSTDPPRIRVSPEPYTWPESRDVIDPEIFTQAKIGTYRADFLIRTPCVNGVHFTAVECDGHDYHERTKEQAQRDKSRDRWLTTNGIATIRFTGSEIWRDPASCVAACTRAGGHASAVLGGKLAPSAIWVFSAENARQRNA